jgi:hypothetical protein
MPEIFVDTIVPTLIATLLAWMQSILSYGVLRFCESKWHWFPYFVFFTAPTYLICAIANSGDESGLLMLLAFSVVAALGSWFHCRSGGASRYWLGAFALVFDAISLSIGFMFIASTSYRIAWGATSGDPFIPLAAYMLGSFCYPALVPLALWIMKSLRLRPGIDVHSQP